MENLDIDIKPINNEQQITDDVGYTNDLPIVEADIEGTITGSGMEEVIPLSKYGDFSTRHVNCMSISNPFGDLMIGDVTVYGKMNVASGIEVSGDKCKFSSARIELNNSMMVLSNTSISVESSDVKLCSLNVDGSSVLNNVTINGNLVVNGLTNGLTQQNIQQKIGKNQFLIFGEESVEGTWRMGIVDGNMCIQKFESGAWINKSTIQ